MKQNLRKISRLLFTLVTVLIACGNVFAQNQTIRGIVIDETNQPLPGVTVMLKGTKQGTTTGVNGRFTISASKGQTLVFSTLGFQSQEIVLAEEVNLSVSLKPDTKSLNEVVVTAFGVKKEFQKIGYSTTEVKGEELTKARDPNPINGLVGKVAGLSVGASAEFLGRPQVVLRGSTDLLYVVDGVPISSDTYNFSPDDVDSYTILKGPNAAALYGFRGINGAIIITTKRGTKDKKGWQIDFNSSNIAEHGFIANPEVQTEYGRGTNFLYQYAKKGYSSSLDYNSTDVLYDNSQRLQEFGPRFEGQLIKQFDSPYDPVTGKRTPTPWLARGANNFDKFAGTGLISTDNLSMAAGGSNYDIRMSYSHTYQKGIFPNTRLNLDNYNLNAGYDITSKLRVEGGLNLNIQYSPNVPDVSYGPNSYAYMFKVYGSSDYNIDDLQDVYKGPQGVNDLVQYAPEYGRENSAWFIAKKWLRSHDKTDIYGNLKVSYKFNDALSMALRSQVTTWDQLRTEIVPASTNLNTYLPWYYFGWYGDYRQDRRRLLENNTDLTLNFNKKISDFSFSGFAGASQRSFTYRSVWETTKDLSSPNVYNLANSQNPILSYNFDSRMQVYSGFYSIDLGYKNYININNTGRIDNLSTLPEGHRNSFYPSVAVSSVVSDYITMPAFISFVKLRASAANVKGGLTSPTVGTAYNEVTSAVTTGIFNSQPVGNLLGYGSELYSTYDGPNYTNASPSGPGTFYNGLPSISLSNTLYNPDLKPYSVTSYEGGLDLKFLGNRLGLDATYFTTNNGPNIFQKTLPNSSGYQYQLVNGVVTLKKGIELQLNGSPLRSSRGLNWDINLNYSTFRETLKETPPGQSTLQQNNHNYVVGDRVDGIYGTKFVRDNSGNIIYNSGFPINAPGGIPNSQLLGYANPDFSFGINNRFSYHNLTLSFQFDGRIGGKIYDFTYYHANNGGTSIESASGDFGTARYAEWLSTNTGTIAPTPKYVAPGVVIASGTPHYTNGALDNASQLTFAPNTTAVTVQGYLSSGVGGNFDEYYMISRSYAKLREVTLGYSIPAKYLKGVVKRASFSLVGRNLLYFAARKDMDLDQYASGYNGSDRSLSGGNTSSADLQTQTARRFGFNINFGF